ncbi:MAG TPA: Cna B-type domain-containing protein, partial [Proteiniclasticum sp.]|nr:Cna B-type domain-containing protein [Proteiniclasticum sp.]
IGSKIKWIGIEHILGMHIKFLPKIDVQCITVEKIWWDGGSKQRPFVVMFDLYANGTKVAVLPIVTNHTDNWETKILVPKTVHGKDIVYTVKEVVHPDLKNYITTVSGLKIINTMTRDITVEKMWKLDHDTVRPDSVSFWLMNGEETVGGKRTLSSANEWKVTIPDVPAYDKDGKIEYTIKEEAVLGYDSYVHEGCLELNGTDTRTLDHKDKCCDDECPDFTIINTFTNEKEITLMKKWIDEDSEKRPDALTFILDKSDGTSVEIPITSADGWKKEVTVELVNENWMYYEYAVDEKMVPEGYEKSIEGFTITNKLKEVVPPVMIEIEGEKTWLDDGTGRPEYIHVKLMADGELLETKKVMPVEGKWMYSFGELPKYDDEMNVIEYEVVEEPVEGYRPVAGEGYDIVNEKVIPISGEKTWLDDGTGRPEYIHVKLMADGKLLETKKVMPVEGKWMYDFGMLPKYDDEMEEIVYTVTEEPVEGYECIPGEDYDISNKRVGMITISGEKTWDDLMNRPASITVYLERNGEHFEEVEVKADEMGKWLYSFKETAKFDEKGMPYIFTVSEKYILGYEAKVTGFNILNVQQRATMKVLKVNEADKPLAGAVFEVRDLSGKVLKTFTTGTDGLFTMDLPLGMYRLVETTPPSGYAKNTVPRLVVLFKAGDVQTIKVVNSFDKPAIVPKPIPSYPVLPKTGSGSELGFYFIGAASFAAGLLTMKKKKN